MDVWCAQRLRDDSSRIRGARCSRPQTVGLIIADIEPHSRPFDLRGWDARMKAVVSGEYASLFGLGEPLAPGTKWRVVHGGSLV